MKPSDPFAKYRNPDRPTYNGAAMLADATGLSQAEIVWTWERLKQLHQVEGRPMSEVKQIVAEESKSRPWLAKSPAAPSN
jgi:hypothetical protein